MSKEDVNLETFELNVEMLSRKLPTALFAGRGLVAPEVADRMGSGDILVTIGAPDTALLQRLRDAFLIGEVTETVDDSRLISEGLVSWSGIILRR